MHNVLYIERNLTPDSIIADQIERLSVTGKVRPLVCALNEDRQKLPEFEFEVMSVNRPPFPKFEAMKLRLWQRSLERLLVRGSTLFFEGFSIGLIHAHFAYPEGCLAYWLSCRTGVPYVITGRGSDMLVYPKQGGYLEKVIRNAVRHADLFIGVSNFLCEVAQSLGIPAARCRMQPHGIPTDVFWWRPEVERGRDPACVLYAGRLHDVKNLDNLLDAFAILLGESEPDVWLCVAGDGPERKRLERRVRQMGLADKVTFLGHLTPAQLADKMRAAGVLVLPSLSEGWPNVIVEALACGLAVVASDTGGISEQITKPALGLLCDPGSPADIAAKIKAVEKRTESAARKRARAAVVWSRDRAVANILGFYDEIIGSEVKGCK